MKKNIMIILIIILLTGCTVDYNLEIKDDNYNEEIKINLTDEEKDNLSLQELYVKNSLSSKIIYQKEIDENILKYSHIYSFDEYQDSALKTYFSKFKISNKDGNYSIVMDDFNGYNNFQASAKSYTFNITTDYNVVNNNCDVKKGNTYTWKINKKNYKNKKIIFQYKKTKDNNNISKYIKPILISLIISCIIVFSINTIVKLKINRE